MRPSRKTWNRIRKDLAVYASLSSNQIVKEPARACQRQESRQPIDSSSLGRNRLTGMAG